MTDLLLALAATAASGAVMYAVCLRPMRRGHRARPATDTATQLALLRREVAALRDQTRVR